MTDSITIPRKDIENLWHDLVQAHGVALVVGMAAFDLGQSSNAHWAMGLSSVCDILVERLDSLADKFDPIRFNKS